MAKGVVLVADDDASVRMVVNQALIRAGFEVRVTSNFSTLWKWIEAGEGDCVVSDVIMPDGEAFEILPRIHSLRPDLPVILISAQNTFMTALKAQEGDAFEYLPKPFDLEKLVGAVERGTYELKTIPPSKTVKPAPSNEMALVGRSVAMQDLYRTIARLRHSTFPVFLVGETGTGKRLVAQVIHDFSDRSGDPFKIINVAGKSQSSLETEIFGEKRSEKNNRSITLGAGTLLLNEVLEIPRALQVRFLQLILDAEGEGSDNQALPRLISSTSGDAAFSIRSGSFREDLYHRLGVVPIRIPPLRERLEDVPDLARHFMKMSETDGGMARHIESEGLQLLKQYSWPGNVRELENLIRRLCLLHPQETITARNIQDQMGAVPVPQTREKVEIHAGFDDLSAATAHFVERHLENNPIEETKGNIHEYFLNQFEKPLIAAVLQATNGNQIKAADALGLNRNTLRKKIRLHQISIIKSVR